MLVASLIFIGQLLGIYLAIRAIIFFQTLPSTSITIPYHTVALATPTHTPCLSADIAAEHEVEDEDDRVVRSFVKDDEVDTKVLKESACKTPSPATYETPKAEPEDLGKDLSVELTRAECRHHILPRRLRAGVELDGEDDAWTDTDTSEFEFEVKLPSETSTDLESSIGSLPSFPAPPTYTPYYPATKASHPIPNPFEEDPTPTPTTAKPIGRPIPPFAIRFGPISDSALASSCLTPRSDPYVELDILTKGVEHRVITRISHYRRNQLSFGLATYTSLFPDFTPALPTPPSPSASRYQGVNFPPHIPPYTGPSWADYPSSYHSTSSAESVCSGADSSAFVPFPAVSSIGTGDRILHLHHSSDSIYSQYTHSDSPSPSPTAAASSFATVANTQLPNQSYHSTTSSYTHSPIYSPTASSFAEVANARLLGQSWHSSSSSYTHSPIYSLTASSFAEVANARLPGQSWHSASSSGCSTTSVTPDSTVPVTPALDQGAFTPALATPENSVGTWFENVIDFDKLEEQLNKV